MATPPSDLIREGYDALECGDATAARNAFEAALAHGETGAVLDGLAQAAYVDEDYDLTMELFERAYAAYRGEGDHVGAIHAASKLGWLNASYRGDAAVMGGWISRAKTLVGGKDTVEHGWVEYYTGMFEALGEKRERHLRTALDTGRRFGDGNLESVALAQIGQGYVSQDRFEEGMVLLDESLAAVVGGDAKDSNIVEIIFCQLFSACEYAQDVVRAEQWIRVGEDFAKRRRLPAIAAWCRTHYGGVLTAAGRWREAEVELNEAARIWGRKFTSLQWQALVRLADLRVRQGRFEEAEQLLSGLDMYTEAARPIAAVHVAKGNTALAADVLERALERMEPDGAATAPLWSLLVEIRVAVGDVDGADAAATHLDAVATMHPKSAHLRATAALARGRVCLAAKDGDPRACLRDALAGFATAQMPMELASARLALAHALVEDQPVVAVAEASIALEAFERLEAARHVDAAAALVRELGGPARTGPKDGTTLTRREAEVLGLLGLGLSNPEIGDRLYISRKTVEHHVGNVLSKLGLRGRAEAAAYAARADRPAERPAERSAER